MSTLGSFVAYADVFYYTQARDEENGEPAAAVSAEPELLFQTIDDVSSLALDAVVPSALYGLDQFGELGTPDLMQ